MKKISEWLRVFWLVEGELTVSTLCIALISITGYVPPEMLERNIELMRRRATLQALKKNKKK